MFYRLTRIEESTSLLSDISYDQTDDSLVKILLLSTFGLHKINLGGRNNKLTCTKLFHCFLFSSGIPLE